MNAIHSLDRLSESRFETPAILKQLAAASRQLAELKGVAGTIPHQGILINTLGLREAKDSSAIENIVTTHDELFREDVFPGMPGSDAAEETFFYASRYLEALTAAGFLQKQKIGRSNYYINMRLCAVLAGDDSGSTAA